MLCFPSLCFKNVIYFIIVTIVLYWYCIPSLENYHLNIKQTMSLNQGLSSVD